MLKASLSDKFDMSKFRNSSTGTEVFIAANGKQPFPESSKIGSPLLSVMLIPESELTHQDTPVIVVYPSSFTERRSSPFRRPTIEMLPELSLCFKNVMRFMISSKHWVIYFRIKRDGFLEPMMLPLDLFLNIDRRFSVFLVASSVWLIVERIASDASRLC
jgi:hypothetical protein